MMLVPVLLAFCATLVFLIALLFLALYVALYRAPSTTSKSSLGRSAAVVVLGDIGRSPRMCYHVESLANEGWKVAVVGYKGTTPPPALRRSSIKHHHLRTPPTFIGKLPRAAFALVAPIKVALQSISLFWQLSATVHPPPEIVLVQTPPALPTLFVVRLVCALLGSRVIIDWHNLGYTILALRMGNTSPLVRLAENLERLTGRKAFAHLFVTSAMMKHLDRKWGLKGRKAVLHDRPPTHFRRSTTEETHELMCRLAPQISPSLADFFPEYQIPDSTPFTHLSSEHESSTDLRPDSPLSWSLNKDSSSPQLRENRPALVVSSTSWTADEDFTLLLHAARLYERRARDLSSFTTLYRRASNGDSLDSTPGLGHNAQVTRTSKERRRPSLGALRSATLPNEPVLNLPKMLIVVTGKGELKASYEREIERLEKEEKWEWVRIRTAWLESEDYPVLLGSADVGVSLHTSSSGIDLPMKVVDMLGCGLPVCALDFACLDELVHDGRNGLIFRDAEGLERQLESLLAQHPDSNWLVNGAGMMNPFDPPTSPGSPLGSTPPLSPSPYFSLLNSPVLGPQRLPRSRTATWTGNWKAVVRPILNATDQERRARSNAGEEHQAPVQAQGFAKDVAKGASLRQRKSVWKAPNALELNEAEIPHIQVSHAGSYDFAGL